ncbi:putative ribonuclease H-like domain-containing protein [Tanacetum coccineum]
MIGLNPDDSWFKTIVLIGGSTCLRVVVDANSAVGTNKTTQGLPGKDLAMRPPRPLGFSESLSTTVERTHGGHSQLYRKSHIPDRPGYEEKFYFNPGDTGFKMFQTKFTKIVVLEVPNWSYGETDLRIMKLSKKLTTMDEKMACKPVYQSRCSFTVPTASASRPASMSFATLLKGDSSRKGKRVASLVVVNYVRNTWSKYGLVKSMLNLSTGLFFFQFSSIDGLDSMLENGLWSSYARALIEFWADVELKDTIVVSMPKLVGEQFYTYTIHVEYEWKPPRYSDVVKNLKKPSQAPRGAPVGPNVGFKPAKQFYRSVSKKTNANTNGNKKKDVELAKEVIKRPILVDLRSGMRKVNLVDDEGRPLEKVDSSGDHDSKDEVKSVDNEVASFLALKKVGYGTKSQEIPCKIQSIYDNLDINVRGRKKK